MDEMQDYEVDDILECLPFLDRPDWERTRMEMYTNVQINSKKKLEPTDIVTFPWDEGFSSGDTSISDSDIDRLTNKASALSKIVKKNGK